MQAASESPLGVDEAVHVDITCMKEMLWLISSWGDRFDMSAYKSGQILTSHKYYQESISRIYIPLPQLRINSQTHLQNSNEAKG